MAAGGSTAAALGAFIVFEDEASISMTPPHLPHLVQAWRTPVIRGRGRSQRRFSIAALACYKHGERSRLIFRPKRHMEHVLGSRRSFTWTGYRDLLAAAHQQLGAPIVLVSGNLNVHLDRRLRAFIDTHDWITSFQLPFYAPDLNPVEGLWSLVRRAGQCNIAFTDPDYLIRVVRRRLHELQYRGGVIDGCLAATGLTRPAGAGGRQRGRR